MKNIIGLNCLMFSSVLLAACDKNNKLDNNNSNNTDTVSKINKAGKKTEKQQQGDIKMSRQKTDSGLSYEILKEGSGANPRPGQQVAVHYTGWLEKNGEPDLNSKFDSSVDRNQPFSFKIGLGYVIAGWDEGVLGMKLGEKRRLFIPAALGYGSRGAGRVIPPNANLVFDVELIKVG